MRRFVLTGAPGSGKSSILAVLADRGYAVVPEAATDVISGRQAQGVDEPWDAPGFIDAVLALQLSRQQQPVADAASVQFFDRSPICTLALARYLGRPIPAALARELDRLDRSAFYEKLVFAVRPIGSVEPSDARRIGYQDSLAFQRLHDAAYVECGYELIDVPAGAVEERATIIEAVIAG
ncbi:MAG TPA: AAA family ATPase [Mycobacteriales bacterium]|jgi:predicted ATPase|nr:AAA family ATPase [Mycobacteriales bacterium]